MFKNALYKRFVIQTQQTYKIHIKKNKKNKNFHNSIMKQPFKKGFRFIIMKPFLDLTRKKILHTY